MEPRMDAAQFHAWIIRPTLTFLATRSGLAVGGLAAERLLLGTALTESELRFINQETDHQLTQLGPACGIYQMEKPTHDDIWIGSIDRQPRLVGAMYCLLNKNPYTDNWSSMCGNLYYATAMCRLKYWTAPAALPDASDLAGLANYWKKWYNTDEGAGRPADFVLKASEITRIGE